MANQRNQTSGLETKTLIKGLLGVSPLPVVGEIALSMFFIDVLDKTDFKYVGIPAALLTRMSMYQQIYIPLFDKIFR